MSPSLVAAASSATRIHVPHVDYLSILPMLIMLGGAIVLVVLSSLFRRLVTVRVGTSVAGLTSAAALVAALFQWDHVATHGPSVTIAGAIAYDGFDVFIQVVVAIAMLLSALVADGYLEREGIEGCEFQVLAMVSASGAMMMGAANDLIVIFLGLEILSIALYVLAGMNPRRAQSGEAALKYFVLGGFSSAIFVYGIALTYGATGSSNLPEIAAYLSRHVLADNGVLLAGMALLLVGFGFKVAAVPFHMWSPDVYEGSPSPVTGFMAAVAKAGAFAALLRVFVSSFATVQADWKPVIWALAFLSLVLGATVALVQRDVKRMLAYSSINHVGFILLGVQAATAKGVAASLYYVFTYMFLTIGSFAVITVMARDGDTGNQITDYRGLARRQPLLATAFAVLLLGQAGAPFTTGFLAKFGVVEAATSSHSDELAVVAMVTAAVAAFMYLRLAVTMYSPVGMVGDLVDGELVDGELVDGELVDGELVDGELVDGELVDGELVDGELVDGELVADGPGRTPAADAPPRLHHDDGATAPTMAGLDLLTDAPPSAEVETRGRVPVPTLTVVAIGLCLAFTVVFGIIPGPVLDFAKQATLLFL